MAAPAGQQTLSDCIMLGTMSICCAMTQCTSVESVTLRWCLQLDAAASARFDGRRTHPSELLLDEAVFILAYALFAALLLVDLVLSCTADTRIP